MTTITMEADSARLLAERLERHVAMLKKQVEIIDALILDIKRQIEEAS